MVRFQPASTLQPNTYYYLQLSGIRDTDGATASTYNLDITTGAAADTTAPTVTAISPPTWPTTSA